MKKFAAIVKKVAPAIKKIDPRPHTLPPAYPALAVLLLLLRYFCPCTLYPGEPINVRGVDDTNAPIGNVGTVALADIPPNPYNRTPPNNPLVDLLELHDSGEPVIWPHGHNSSSARHFINDYVSAVDVAFLHTPKRWVPNNNVQSASATSTISISRRTALDNIHPELRGEVDAVIPTTHRFAMPWPFSNHRTEVIGLGNL